VKTESSAGRMNIDLLDIISGHSGQGGEGKRKWRRRLIIDFRTQFQDILGEEERGESGAGRMNIDF